MGIFYKFKRYLKKMGIFPKSVSIVNGVIYVNNKKVASNNNSFKPVNQKKTVAEGIINKIDINSSPANVNIISHNKNEIQISLYGNYSANDAYVAELSTKLINDCLKIGTDDKGTLSFFSGELTLDIFIPESFSGEVTANTNRGGLSIETEKLNLVEFKSQSGDLILQLSELNTLKTQLDSGAAKVTLNSAGILDINILSGNVDIECARFESISVDTISGDIQLKTKAAIVNASALVGEIDNEFKRSGSSNIAKLSTMSGNITAERML